MPFIYGNMGLNNGHSGGALPDEPITTTDTVIFTVDPSGDAELTAESETASLLKTDRT